MMVISADEAMLEPSEFMLEVHLDSHQGNRSPVADALKGDLASAHRDVLEAIHHLITLSIQGPGNVVRCQLEGLQFLCQG